MGTYCQASKIPPKKNFIWRSEYFLNCLQWECCVFMPQMLTAWWGTEQLFCIECCTEFFPGRQELKNVQLWVKHCTAREWWRGVTNVNRYRLQIFRIIATKASRLETHGLNTALKITYLSRWQSLSKNNVSKFICFGSQQICSILKVASSHIEKK